MFVKTSTWNVKTNSLRVRLVAAGGGEVYFFYALVKRLFRLLMRKQTLEVIATA
jgi:hypothetical protein